MLRRGTLAKRQDTANESSDDQQQPNRESRQPAASRRTCQADVAHVALGCPHSTSAPHPNPLPGVPGRGSRTGELLPRLIRLLMLVRRNGDCVALCIGRDAELDVVAVAVLFLVGDE